MRDILLFMLEYPKAVHDEQTKRMAFADQVDWL